MNEPSGSSPGEWSRFYRPEGTPGTEVLHARYLSHRYAPHIHDKWTVATVDHGTARFARGRIEYVAPAGSVFLIPPGVVHTGESATPDGYSYRVVYLDVQEDRDDSWPLVGSTSLPVVTSDRSLRASLRRFHALLARHDTRLERDEALGLVVGAITAIAGKPPSTPYDTHPTVTLAVDYLTANWNREISLHDLAEISGVSSSHLIRLFNRRLGVAPSGYQRALRVAAAQRLIRQGCPLPEVSLRCGFYDQSHLNRHFKRAIGVTPGHYAAAIRVRR
jgi:AraC-like DNA-binding protein